MFFKNLLRLLWLSVSLLFPGERDCSLGNGGCQGTCRVVNNGEDQCECDAGSLLSADGESCIINTGIIAAN